MPQWKLGVGDIINDIGGRLPHYRSDWQDGLKYKNRWGQSNPMHNAFLCFAPELSLTGMVPSSTLCAHTAQYNSHIAHSVMSSHDHKSTTHTHTHTRTHTHIFMHDACRRILAPALYIMFASLLPALAFGEQLANETEGLLTVVHVLAATALAGLVQVGAGV